MMRQERPLLSVGTPARSHLGCGFPDRTPVSSSSPPPLLVQVRHPPAASPEAGSRNPSFRSRGWGVCVCGTVCPLFSILCLHGLPACPPKPADSFCGLGHRVCAEGNVLTVLYRGFVLMTEKRRNIKLTVFKCTAQRS